MAGRQAGTSTRMACRISELVIDSRDPERLAAFWCDVLGYVVLDRVENSVEICPENEGFGGLQPTIVFDATDKPKAGKLPLRVPSRVIAPLQNWSFFWTWDSHTNTVRWMNSFATTHDDMSRFAAGMHHVTDSPARGRTHPAVSALVYIAAFAPDAGESVQTLTSNPAGCVHVPGLYLS